MRDVLRLVPLIGMFVEAECRGQVWTGVVDAVTTTESGVSLWTADGTQLLIKDPDEWVIDVYRRAPNGR